MKTIKVSETTPIQLDWLVAKCEGVTDTWRPDGPFMWNGVACIRDFGHDVRFTPSTDWAQGGPIIEREGIELNIQLPNGHPRRWVGMDYSLPRQSGPTPLITAMRCFCASKLGNEVEVPEGL